MTTSSFDYYCPYFFSEIHFKKNIAELPSSLAIPNEN